MSSNHTIDKVSKAIVENLEDSDSNVSTVSLIDQMKAEILARLFFNLSHKQLHDIEMEAMKNNRNYYHP